MLAWPGAPQTFNVTHNMTDNIHKIKQAGPQYGQKGHLVDTKIEPGAPYKVTEPGAPYKVKVTPKIT